MDAKVLLTIDETAIVAVIIMGLAAVDKDLAFEVAHWPPEKLEKLAQALREKILTECSVGTAQFVVQQKVDGSSSDN